MAVDVSMIHQVEGFLFDTPWLELYDAQVIPEHSIKCAVLKGGARESPVFPSGWSYARSLYADGVCISREGLASLLPISSDGGVDMVVDLSRGRALYTASSTRGHAQRSDFVEGPPLDLASTPREVWAREEAAIEFARQSLVESGESIVPNFAPAKRLLRRQPIRHAEFVRPSLKTVDELTKLYGLWRFPVVVVGMIGLLYGRAAGTWAGETFDAIFLTQRQQMEEEEKRFAGVDYLELPAVSRLPIPTLFLNVLAQHLPPYDSGLTRI